jgi:hypothetical protein
VACRKGRGATELLEGLRGKGERSVVHHTFSKFFTLRLLVMEGAGILTPFEYFVGISVISRGMEIFVLLF